MAKTTEEEKTAVCAAVAAEVENPSAVPLARADAFWWVIAEKMGFAMTAAMAKDTFEKCRKAGREGLPDLRRHISNRVKHTRRQHKGAARLATFRSSHAVGAPPGEAEEEKEKMESDEEEDEEEGGALTMQLALPSLEDNPAEEVLAAAASAGGMEVENEEEEEGEAGVATLHMPLRLK